MFDFLAGFNAEYDSICIQILGKDPFPSLNEVYSYVQEEEDRRHDMLNPTSLSSIEKSALLSSNQWGGRGGSHGCSSAGRGSFRDGRGGFSEDER